MKTKKHILLLLSVLMIGALAAINLTVYASGGGSGGSGPGGSSTSDSGDSGDNSSITTSSTSTTTTTTTTKTTSTTGDNSTSGTDSDTTSGTSDTLGDDMFVSCLPKRFTELPDQSDSSYKIGLCSGGRNFLFINDYTKTNGNFVEQYFEGVCTAGPMVETCHYKIDTIKCLNDELECPSGTKLKRTGDECKFDECPGIECGKWSFTCPDGTVIKSRMYEGVCAFPSCPINPECNEDTFTCNDGSVVKRTGDDCVFACPADINCNDKPKTTCPDGSEMGQVKQNGVCVNPICPPVDTVGYSISGKITADNTNLAGITIQVFDLSGNIITSTTTASDGSYNIEGLKIGSYKIKPVSTGDYIFIFPTDSSSSIVKIEKSNVSNRNFNAAYLKNITDTKIKDGIINIANKEGFTSGSSGSSLTSGTNDSSLTSWLQNLSSDNSEKSTSDINSTAAELSNIGDTLTNNSPLTSNSLISLLQNGFTLEDKSYSPVTLSLINKKANPNAICGDGLVVEGETCDDGRNNGKNGYCSTDCLYIGEVHSSNENNLASNAFGGNYQNSNSENYKRGSLGNVTKKLSEWSHATSQLTGQLVKKFSVLGNNIIKSSINVSQNVQDWSKKTVIAHTSAHTRKIMKETAEVTVEAAKYSAITVGILLGAAAVSLNIMVFKSQWRTYTVQDGETFDTLGSKFNMTERALRRRNGLGKKGLRSGMKIKVRNRAFIEKDYLDQLKSVLTDSLKTKDHGHMAEKIEKMFAKK